MSSSVGQLLPDPSTADTAPRSAGRSLRIVVVSGFYSEGMGYTENCLPRALAALGHEVHVVTSTYNAYGTSAEYDVTYAAFLGPRQAPAGTRTVDGYQVHRLPTRILGGYVKMQGLSDAVRRLRPDIVHSIEIASLQTWELALRRPLDGFALFCETHQHMSVVRPYLKEQGALVRKGVYRITRTLPTALASLAVERCYAIAPDCVEVATRFYGVPASKVTLLSLGTDTELFRPAVTPAEMAARAALRASFGASEDDVVCVYSGRFSRDKNPLVLAQAIDRLSRRDPRFHGLFVGEGVQREEIAACRQCHVVPFMSHRALADHYRAADVGVWPTQESMSMLDAAAAGLPVVASDRMGERVRVEGNGRFYVENDADSLAESLASLGDPTLRRELGAAGRRKMLEGFSWLRFARRVDADYHAALATP